MGAKVTLVANVPLLPSQRVATNVCLVSTALPRKSIDLVQVVTKATSPVTVPQQVQLVTLLVLAGEALVGTATEVVALTEAEVNTEEVVVPAGNAIAAE